MRTIIRNVIIADKSSSFNGRKVNVCIEDDVIALITENSVDHEKADHVIDGSGKYLFSGLFDLHARFREPGEEYKETIDSGCMAAAQGGFTEVLLMPDTTPAVDNKSQVDYILNRSIGKITDVHVAGAISMDLKGKDLSEMHDMFLTGARVFTDDKHSVQDAGLLIRALLYSRDFNARIFNFPNDKSISGKGVMNEGQQSTLCGLRGIPAIAEEIMVERDIMLSVYTDTNIHLSTISTAGSVEKIRRAKKAGYKITCDVAAHNLLLDDSHLSDFNSLYKLMPPLRTNEDISALIEGLKDNTIDAICSDHSPEHTESKKTEFDLAAYGISCLETSLSCAFTALKNHLDHAEIFSKLNSNPRSIIGLPVPVIEEKAKANLVLFDPANNWTVREWDIKSKSKNNPFINTQLIGRVEMVYNNSILHFCN